MTSALDTFVQPSSSTSSHSQPAVTTDPIIRHLPSKKQTRQKKSMGGGNGAKSAAARERNLAKKLKDQKQKEHKENRGKVNNDNIKCKICMTTFMVTANVKLLNEHFDSKHNSKGMKIEQCFPHLAPAQS